MCRILVADSVALKDSDLTNAFVVLDEANGGHGTGVWHSSVPVIMKGLDMGPKTAAGYLKAASQKPGLGVFHTRLASAGGEDSFLNHPFRVGPKTVLVHNGHWHYYPQELGLSDTHAVVNGIKAFGFEFISKNNPTGVWVIAHSIDSKKGHYAVFIFRIGSGYSILVGKYRERVVAVSQVTSHLKYDTIVTLPENRAAFFIVDENGARGELQVSIERAINELAKLNIKLDPADNTNYADVDLSCDACSVGVPTPESLINTMSERGYLDDVPLTELEAFRDALEEGDWDACTLCPAPSCMLNECPVYHRYNMVVR